MLCILENDRIGSSLNVLREGIPVQLSHDGLRVPVNL
jgi:hypothetical protein